jgi:hypothetical protein
VNVIEMNDKTTELKGAFQFTIYVVHLCFPKHKMQFEQN